jgi:hypothetical protein
MAVKLLSGGPPPGLPLRLNSTATIAAEIELPTVRAMAAALKRQPLLAR